MLFFFLNDSEETKTSEVYILTNQDLTVGFYYSSYSMEKDNPEIEVAFPRVSGTEEGVASALLTLEVALCGS